MSLVLERVTSIAVGVAALLVAGSVARREFAQPPRQVDDRQRPVFQPDWKDFRRVGIPTVGDSTAPVQIVEFGDFECPVCAAFEPTLQEVTSRYGQRVARVFVHFPLPGHRFARLAALAAECAEQQGVFPTMKVALYAQQDSFGLRPWTAFALDAGVEDVSRFDNCMTAGRDVARINEGFSLAQKLGFQGTPTIVVNGWAINGIMRDSMLARTIDAVLDGKVPPGAREGR